MSIRKRPSEDDSKTIDKSVVIHDDIEAVGTAVSMDELLSAQSVPPNTKTQRGNKSRPESARLSGSKKNLHSRLDSVSNLIPLRFLNQAPSLIALLDVQKSRTNKITIPRNSFRISKSVPDMQNNTDHMDIIIDADGDQSPTLETEGTDDFPSKDLTKSRLSQENIATQLQGNSSMDSMVIKDDKQIEYETLIQGIGDNVGNDEMVDMQMLALKAAEEFTVLANENDALVRENFGLKEQFDDLEHEKEKLMNELNDIKHKHEDNSELVNDIDILKSKAKQWEIEKQVLMEQLQSKNRKRSSVDMYDSMNGKTALKLKNDTSEDAQRLMMETVATLTREKNELENIMTEEQTMKREYEMTISNLKKELRDKDFERDRLSNDLDKQQQLFINLKQNAKKKELEIDNIVGRNRNKTIEAEQQTQEYRQRLADQQARIRELEEENLEINNNKIHEDDQMFDELKQLRQHRFQKSTQMSDGTLNFAFGAGSDGYHSRNSSELSNYSQSGFGVVYTHNAELGLKTMRTQINLFGAEDFEDIGEEDVVIDLHPQSQPTTHHLTTQPSEDLDTPQPSDQPKKVGFSATDAENKQREQKKRAKREQMEKINTEIEFFMLTCIAVKMNLAEEYPEKPEVLTENPLELYSIAQKDGVVMSKFNIWIEYNLREKYELPKLEGFKKFMEDHHVKDNLKKGYKKTKKGTKKLAKKTEKASMKAGLYIAEKAEEIGMRIRAYSRNEEKDGDTRGFDTPVVEMNEDIEIKDELDLNSDNDRTENKELVSGEKGDDKGKVSAEDNKQCCLVM